MTYVQEWVAEHNDLSYDYKYWEKNTYEIIIKVDFFLFLQKCLWVLKLFYDEKETNTNWVSAINAQNTQFLYWAYIFITLLEIRS